MTNLSTITETAILDFELEYAGPALELNEMSIDDLAPALLSAARVFQISNHLANPTDREIRVNVTATRAGSFVVALKLIYDHTSNVLENRGVAGLEGLFSLVIGIVGLKLALKQNGAPQSVERLPEGQVRLTFLNGVTLDFSGSAWEFVDNPELRIPLLGMVNPLSKDGIERMRIRREGEIEAEVSSEDADAFEPDSAPPREVLVDSTTEVWLTIRTLSLERNLAWRFSDGGMNFVAPITDEVFLERIENRESFAKGDVLRCRLRTIQTRDYRGVIHSEFEVTEVIEHDRPPDAGPRLFEGD